MSGSPARRASTKVFRMASKVEAGLPAQHVEAKRFHYSTTSRLSPPTINPNDPEDPFTTAAQQTPLARVVPAALLKKNIFFFSPEHLVNNKKFRVVVV